MSTERGKFVVLVGPDGVGKTSVAEGVLRERHGHYFHFRPPLGRRWSPPAPGDTTRPTPPPRSGVVVSVLRVVKALTLFWLGYLTAVRPEVSDGALVIGDRWGYGYLVHPHKLGVVASPRLARALLRVLPQPDLVFALVADPETIHLRKKELTPEAAAAEVEAWSTLPISRLIRVDAERPVAEIVAEIVERLDRPVTR